MLGYYLLGGSSLVLAHHPNEGSLTLTQLMAEAEANNLEIKESEKKLESLKKELTSLEGRFLPQISLEGGILTSKLDDEKVSGSAVYGKTEWNIYRGGVDKIAIDKGQEKLWLEEKKVKLLKVKIHREVAVVYYELLFLYETQDLKEKALELNQEQMKLAQRKRSSGFTSETDVIEFDLREAELKSDLKMISQQIMEKTRELAIVLSRKESAPILIKGHLERESWNPERKKLLEQLRESNLDLIVASTELKLSQLDVKQEEAEFLPKLDLEAKYGKLASEEKVYAENNNYSVMLKLNIPLFSGLETLNRTKSAKSLQQGQVIALERKYISLKSDFENILDLFFTITERLALEEKNLNKSESYYKLTLEEYRRGVKNSPDMVGASKRLLEVRIRNLEYRRDYYLTKLKIYAYLELAP